MSCETYCDQILQGNEKVEWTHVDQFDECSVQISHDDICAVFTSEEICDATRLKDDDRVWKKRSQIN